MKVRRAWALPLVPVYRAVLSITTRLRKPARRLEWPVVSVGSISAGGAGKTPVVIALAEMLTARGWGVNVLSRGYGRRGRGVALVLPKLDGAAEVFGDEPVLIARRAGAPVWVGADRFRAGMAAEGLVLEETADSSAALRTDNKKGRDKSVHLLDDGFQHRRLARQFDIVLVTAEDLDDALLPAGNLREPVEALRRADAVVIRDDEAGVVEARLLELLQARRVVSGKAQATEPSLGVTGWKDRESERDDAGRRRSSSLVGVEALVWKVRRTLRFPAPLFCFGAGLRPVAFCAIARPEGFAAMLAKAGCGVAETVFFRDHHRYDMQDVERIIEVAKGLNASGLVTTEKDAVKLTPAMLERMEAEVGPVMVAELVVEFVYPERVMRELENRLMAVAAGVVEVSA